MKTSQNKMPDHVQHGCKNPGSYFYSVRNSVEEKVVQREEMEGDVFGSIP